MQIRGSPQLRFIARGAFLSVAMVVLWYWALLNPILGGLRVSTDVMVHLLLPGSSAASHIAVDPSGDWAVPISIAVWGGQTPAWLSRYVPAGNGAAKISAIDVKVSRSTLSLFTLSLPLYWAIILAAPHTARFWRALTVGTFLIAAAAPVFGMVFVAIVTAQYFHQSGRGVEFALEVAAYLVTYVAPYISSLVLAIMLHPELRSLVFPWEAEKDRLPSDRGARPRARKPRSSSAV